MAGQLGPVTRNKKTHNGKTRGCSSQENAKKQQKKKKKILNNAPIAKQKVFLEQAIKQNEQKASYEALI